VAEDARSPGWRSIDALADLIGAYAWMEQRIFSITGGFATAPWGDGDADGDADSDVDARLAEARLWCAALSRRHGARAVQWAARLPVRAGVDARALVRAPTSSLEGVLEALSRAPDLLTGLAAVLGVWLPSLDRVYESHLGDASPVSEAPVLEVLADAHQDLVGEISGGRALLDAVSGDGAGGGDLGAELERAFAGWRVFPAVWAS
jgi:hypothetical protein